MGEEKDRAKNSDIPEGIREELLEYLRKNMGVSEKKSKKYFTSDIEQIRKETIKDRKLLLDLTNKFLKEKGLEVERLVVAMTYPDWGDNISNIQILSNDKRSVRNFNEMCIPHPKLENIIETIRINKTLTITVIKGKKYKIYGVKDRERKIKRLFKEYLINKIDLSRISLDPSVFLTFASFRNFIIKSPHPIVCKLGTEKTSENLIAQFYPLEEDE